MHTVPSAGTRHYFETYVLVNRVEGLKQGLYRFLTTEHIFQEMETDPGIAERITQACFNQRFVMQSAATFIWTAVAYRMMWRYGERGYRYMHLDAGHVCQNLYSAAEVGADAIWVDGIEGGTGAAPAVVTKHAGIPTIAYIMQAVDGLEEIGLKGKVSLILSGGIRNGAEIAKSLALGANAVGISIGFLVAMGCVLCMQCAKGQCQKGISSQDP